MRVRDRGKLPALFPSLPVDTRLLILNAEPVFQDRVLTMIDAMPKVETRIVRSLAEAVYILRASSRRAVGSCLVAAYSRKSCAEFLGASPMPVRSARPNPLLSKRFRARNFHRASRKIFAY